jgi:hypothetical protein
MMQSIIQTNELTRNPVIVTNKRDGASAEAFVHGRASTGNPLGGRVLRSPSSSSCCRR